MRVTAEQAERFNDLLANKVLVCVNPVDTWDEWGWSVIVEDIMSPFAVIEYSNPSDPYPTFAQALEGGLCFGEMLEVKPKE